VQSALPSVVGYPGSNSLACVSKDLVHPYTEDLDKRVEVLVEEGHHSGVHVLELIAEELHHLD
jgi:hypothetical protein